MEIALSLDRQLLDILCCPVTHVPLMPMPQGQLQALSAAIARGEIRDRGDEQVVEPLTEALVTRDGKLAYPVRDGIPVLLEEQGILLSQLEASATS